MDGFVPVSDLGKYPDPEKPRKEPVVPPQSAVQNNMAPQQPVDNNYANPGAYTPTPGYAPAPPSYEAPNAVPQAPVPAFPMQAAPSQGYGEPFNGQGPAAMAPYPAQPGNATPGQPGNAMPGQPGNYMPGQPANAMPGQPPVKRKKMWAGILLLLFFGGFGAHNFYYGNYVRAVIELLYSPLVIVLAIVVSEYFLIAVLFLTIFLIYELVCICMRKDPFATDAHGVPVE